MGGDDSHRRRTGARIFAGEGAFDLEPFDLDRRTLQEVERVFSARLDALNDGAWCDVCRDAEAHAFLTQLRNLIRTTDRGGAEPGAPGATQGREI